jgi:hypothetical protein
MNKSTSKQLFSLPFLNSRYYLLLFILWPFLAFLLALYNYSQKDARKVVYIFLIYYGFSFVNGNEFVDAARYATNLKANSLLPFSDFFKIVGGIYATDTSIDIVEPFISFVVSRFTSFHGVYFGVWAIIFGFFYLRSINLLHDLYIKNPGWNAMAIMAFFTLILPITSISGVRMWTAGWIFFYGAYHVVINRDPRYILLSLSASLVHFSFLSANVILLIYYFAGNRDLIYLPIVLASFVVPHFIAPVFQSISLKLGGAFQNRFEGYSNEEYVLASRESIAQAAWFLQIVNNLVFYYLLLALAYIKIRYGSMMKGKAESNLFSFLLIFLAFVNFGMPIPAFGSRFQMIFFLFATYYIFLFFIKLPGNKVYLLTILGLFPMLLYSAVTFRLGSESISAWLLTPGLGSPLVLPVLSISDLMFH